METVLYNNNQSVNLNIGNKNIGIIANDPVRKLEPDLTKCNITNPSSFVFYPNELNEYTVIKSTANTNNAFSLKPINTFGYSFGTIDTSGSTTADTFAIKFRLNDLASNTIKGTAVSYKDISTYYNSALYLGFYSWTTSYAFDLYGERGPAIEGNPNGIYHFCRVSWSNSTGVGVWINVELKVNNSGYWCLDCDYSPHGGYVSTTNQDTVSQDITHAFDKILDIKNMYGYQPDVDIDLAGTGFKKNGEWVVRYVK